MVAIVKGFRFESFAAAFFAQKSAELVVLAALLSTGIYIGTRLEHPSKWGMTGGATGVSDSLLMGLTGASIFFAFTLYPVVTYAILSLCRKFDADTQPWMPVLSPLVSVGYVASWVFFTEHAFPVIPYWIMTAIMALFIFVSSLALYPQAQPAIPAVG